MVGVGVVRFWIWVLFQVITGYDMSMSLGGVGEIGNGSAKTSVSGRDVGLMLASCRYVMYTIVPLYTRRKVTFIQRNVAQLYRH